jgi:hypothetical protein
LGVGGGGHGLTSLLWEEGRLKVLALFGVSFLLL